MGCATYRYLFQLPVALLFSAAASGAALDQAQAPLPRESAALYSCDAHDTSMQLRTDFSRIGRVEGAPAAQEHAPASTLKDALRTLTGLIGCADAGKRAIRVPTTTMGIR